MSRRPVIAALAGAAIAAPSSALAADAASPGPAAKLAACHVSTAPAGRYAVFTGSMTAQSGTKRMWMRFDLEARIPPSLAFTAVTVPRWGRWEKSHAGVPGFVFTRRVARLAAPGTYRAVVRFRWYDAHDLLQRRARRVSANCRQPDVRPDLTGALLGAVAGPQPGEATYTFRVRNQGHGAAGAFAVALTTDRTPQPLQPLPGLAAGGQQDIALTGPACRPGSVVRLAIDSSSAIAEANEDNNVVDVACPLAASASRR